MKKITLSMAMLLTAGLFFLAQAGSEEKKSSVIAVKFHADWCGACKAMASDVKALPGEFEGNQNIRFYTFDLTSEDTKKESLKLAKDLGIDDIYKDNQKTGFMLVIDANSKEVLEKLTRKDDLGGMVTKIKAQL